MAHGDSPRAYPSSRDGGSQGPPKLTEVRLVDALRGKVDFHGLDTDVLGLAGLRRGIEFCLCIHCGCSAGNGIAG